MPKLKTISGTVDVEGKQYIGIGPLVVDMGDRGEMKALSTDWIVEHETGKVVMPDAMFTGLFSVVPEATAKIAEKKEDDDEVYGGKVGGGRNK